MQTLAVDFGELRLDDRGRVVVIQGTEKVAQEVIGALLLRLKPPFVQVGSDFSSLIDRYAAASRILNYVRFELQKAIDSLKRLQESQLPALPADEVIEEMVDLDIQSQQVGAIDMSFRVIVRSGKRIPIEQRLILNSVSLDAVETAGPLGLTG